jgi:CHAT domain-containing protein
MDALPVDDDRASELKFRLAAEYGEIHLYHRSFEIINSIPSRDRRSEISSFGKKLQSALEWMRSPARQLGILESAPTSSRDLYLRLAELLGQAPTNGWYDEFEVVDRGDASSETDLSSLMPDRGPLFMRIFEYLESGASEEPDVSSGPRHLDPARLTSEESDVITQLYESINRAPRVQTSAFKHHPGIDILARKAFGNESIVELQLIDRSPTGILFSFRCEYVEQLWYVNKRDNSSRAAAYSLGEYDAIGGSVGMRHYDVNADSIPEIVLASRVGSGGFLTVRVIDTEQMRDLFHQWIGAKGRAVFLDIDQDPHVEILATCRARVEQVVSCNQCPSMYEAYLLDYSPSLGEYRVIGEDLTSSEYNIESYGLMGAGPHIAVAYYLEDYDIPGIMDFIRGDSLLLVDDTVTIRNLLRLAEYVETLQDAGVHQQVLEICQEVIRALEQTGLEREYLQRLTRYYWKQLIALYMALGDLESTEQMLNEPYLQKLQTQQIAFHADNIVSVLRLTTGRLAEAYAAIVRHCTSEDVHGVFHGNLAYYYQLIGDHVSSYSAATEALKYATRAGLPSNTVRDMILLSRSSYLSGDTLEALDWLTRALRDAKVGSGGASLWALKEAASIAVENGFPVLALVLLDQAMLINDEASWQSGGGGYFLLYGKALRDAGFHDYAARCYQLSSKLSREIDHSVNASAYYEMSTQAYDEGSLSLAHDYGAQAFSAITRGRRRIGEELHKFEFLQEHEDIASWYFYLSRKSGRTPEQIFTDLERWKLQTLMDLYLGELGDERRIDDDRELLGAIRENLEDDDILLNYFVSDDTAFVVSVTRSGGTGIHTLDLTRADLSTQVLALRQHFDIRDQSALTRIRYDDVPVELTSRLRSLHDALISVPVPRSGMNRLIIVPDRDLYGIPWAALLDADGNAVVDRFETVIVPSCRFLFEVSGRKDESNVSGPSPDSVLLLVGSLSEIEDAAVSPSADSETATAVLLPRLRYGWRECVSVENSFPQYEVRYLLDGKSLGKHAADIAADVASPANVLDHMEKSTVAHIIAHGSFNQDQPMRSAIFLEADSTGCALRAEDVARADLHGLQFVCLSACESGMTAGMPGAEPVGFLRGFLGAGVGSVMLFEWDIDDLATSQLLSSFYGRFQTQRLTTALRSAQLEIREDLKHPYYWAGLTLYGAWE